MKKTYEAPTNQGYMMGLNLRGKQVSIKFDDGQISPRVINNKFTTADPELQTSIEATKQFKIGSLKCIKTEDEISYGISDTSGEKPKIMEPKTENDVSKEVYEDKVLKYKSLQQVANYLVANYAIDISTLTSPEIIKKIAEEKNLLLPNIK